MSELKATTIYDAYWKANSTGEGTGILVYLKSEADKLIAEKDKTIAELQKTNAQLASSCVMLNRLLDTREEEVKALKQKLEDVNELIKTARKMLEESDNENP